MAAADFFTVEVWSWRGLMTHYVFFVIELATRRMRIAGITGQPDAGWMMQMGRNLLDVFNGPLVDKWAPRQVRGCSAVERQQPESLSTARAQGSEVTLVQGKDVPRSMPLCEHDE